jgi:hypothetical protein
MMTGSCGASSRSIQSLGLVAPALVHVWAVEAVAGEEVELERSPN